MEQIGLVGLPNAGKSSLFNALTGLDTPVAPHPFSTMETAQGIASVPDHRLDQLAAMSKSVKVIHAGVEVVDIAALVPGANTGEGLGNRFLGSLRDCDALCFVLRAFDDASIPGETDPAAALASLELELVLADLESAEGRLNRVSRAAKGDKSLGAEVAALTKAVSALSDGIPLFRSDLTDDERALLHEAFLLTNKRVLFVVNVGEDDVERAAELAASIAPDALGLCVQLEAEAATLDPEARGELLEGLGLGEGALPRVARAAYHLLGRRTFLTTGDKESRAWTFRAGAHAPECAGIIHSDLQRGFIRAEIIRWDELLEIGSWTKAKDLGKLRVEGKDYEVVDGDVLEIRFNV